MVLVPKLSHTRGSVVQSSGSSQMLTTVRVPKSEFCTVCRRRAYPMDALIMDKKKYHKSCFCCEHCKNKLSLGNYVSLHGHFYCLPHYKQLLNSKGNYNNGLGQKPPTGRARNCPVGTIKEVFGRRSCS
uniref:Xin actin binding repeat containing 2b n=2 Tax=Mastacembelus armatus TaxID=205130 RepID=A0A3Q3RNE0_9TELE